MVCGISFSVLSQHGAAYKSNKDHPSWHRVSGLDRYRGCRNSHCWYLGVQRASLILETVLHFHSYCVRCGSKDCAVGNHLTDFKVSVVSQEIPTSLLVNQLSETFVGLGVPLDLIGGADMSVDHDEVVGVVCRVKFETAVDCDISVLQRC